MSRKTIHSLIAILALIFFVSPIGATTAHASGWMMGLAETFADWGGEAVIDIVLRAVGAVLEYVIVPIFSWLMTGFGGVFDAALRFSLDTCNYAPPSAPVVTGSNASCSAGGITAINTGWVLIRDFMNIGFIFIILYIAISTILRNTGAQTKRLLGGLVIAAILVNFSMFIASLVIDAGNVLGVAFYNAIQDGSGNVGSISQAIAGGLDIQELYNPIALSGTDQVLSAAVRIVIFSVLAAAFLMAAILFIGRIVAFIFLLTVSPVGFVGFMLPKLKKYSSQWWEMLLKQSFMAPIFLFFMYIIIVVINESKGVFQAVDKVGGLTINTYFTFAIIMGLVFAAIKITKDLSGKLGSSMLKLGGMAAGLALGGTALVARGAVGGAAARFMKSDRANTLRETAVNDKGLKGAASRIALRTGHKARTGSFDIRQTKTVGKGLSSLEKNTGLAGITKTGRVKKGFEQSVEDRKKKEVERFEKIYSPEETARDKAQQADLKETQSTLRDTIKNLQTQKAQEEKFSDSGRASSETLQEIEQVQQELAEADVQIKSHGDRANQAMRDFADMLESRTTTLFKSINTNIFGQEEPIRGVANVDRYALEAAAELRKKAGKTPEERQQDELRGMIAKWVEQNEKKGDSSEDKKDESKSN